MSKEETFQDLSLNSPSGKQDLWRWLYDDLRDQLRNAEPCTPTLQCELKQQRRVINDIHKRVVCVTKSLEKRAY